MTEIAKKVEGRVMVVGETEVFVAPHPGGSGFAVRLKTGEVVTEFGISEATLNGVLVLMMQQGGIRVPGLPLVFSLPTEEA